MTVTTSFPKNINVPMEGAARQSVSIPKIHLPPSYWIPRGQDASSDPAAAPPRALVAVEVQGNRINPAFLFLLALVLVVVNITLSQVFRNAVDTSKPVWKMVTDPVAPSVPATPVTPLLTPPDKTEMTPQPVAPSLPGVPLRYRSEAETQ